MGPREVASMLKLEATRIKAVVTTLLINSIIT